MKRHLPATLLVSLAFAACADTPTAVTPDDTPSINTTLLEPVARAGTLVVPGVDFPLDPEVSGRAQTGPQIEVNMTHGSSTLVTTYGGSPGPRAQSLAGPGVTITNVNYIGIAHALGSFHGGAEIIGIESGVILSTGFVENVLGPNRVPNRTTVNNRPGDAALTGIAGATTYDAAILEFTFVPLGDQVSFEYVFASEEYPEWVGSVYNDPFAFFVNGQNCAQVGNTGMPVTINNVNAGTNSAFFRANTNAQGNPGGLGLNTEMDGLTVVLVCQAAVNANQPNTLRLAIADAGDREWDSNVFIKAGSISVTVPGQISLTPATATQPENPAAAHTVQAQVRFANGAPQPNVSVAFEVVSGPNAGATGTGVTNSLGQTSFTWFDLNGDGTDLVKATYFDVADDVEKFTTAEMVWSVVNEAPTAAIAGSVVGAEGSSVPFDGSGSSDPDGDALTYAWDFGDGSTGTGAAPSHVYADNGTYTVTLVVNDGTVDSAPVTTTAEIANIAPVVSMPADASLVESGTFNGSGSFTDPGADAWSATVDYGDGSGAQSLALIGNNFQLSHTYADNGAYTVTVVVTETDAEAGSGSGTTDVAVSNAAPIVEAGADVSLVSGDDFSLTGTFSDIGADDAPWQWSIDFAGSTATGATSDQGATITAASHAYMAAGTYTVVLTVTDKDGGSGQDALTVTVARVAAGIDIKPGSFPNSINGGNGGNGKGNAGSSNGTVPVAVLGSATLDVSQIDIGSITLGDLSGTDTPVNVKNNGQPHAGIEDVDSDGYADLVLHFSRAALIANGDLVVGTTSLALRGDMQNGQQFEGSDSVNVVP